MMLKLWEHGAVARSVRTRAKRVSGHGLTDTAETPPPPMLAPCAVRWLYPGDEEAVFKAAAAQALLTESPGADASLRFCGGGA